MDQRLDDMRQYLRIAGTNLLEDKEEVILKESSELLVENTIKNNQILVEELNDIVFKLRSYQDLSEDQQYALGVEEGLSLAADMIINFINRHSEV